MSSVFNEGDWVWHQKHGVGRVGLVTSGEVLVEFDGGGEEVFEIAPKKKIPLTVLSPNGFWLRKRDALDEFGAAVRTSPLEALLALVSDGWLEIRADELKSAVMPELVTPEQWEDWLARLSRDVKADPRFEIGKSGQFRYRGELQDIAGDLIARFKQAPSLREKNKVVKEMLLLEQKGVPMDDVRETAVSFFTGANISRTNKMSARLEALIFLEELDAAQHGMLAGPFFDELRALTVEQAAEAVAETNESAVRVEMFRLFRELKPDEFIEISKTLAKRFKKTQRDWTLDTLLELEDKSYIKTIVDMTLSDIATNKQPFVWIFKCQLEKPGALAALGLNPEHILNLVFKTLNNIHFTSAFSAVSKDGPSISREEDEMVKMLKNEKKIMEFLDGQPRNIVSVFAGRYCQCLAIESEEREEFVKKILARFPGLEIETEERAVPEKETYRLTRETYERFREEYRELVDVRIQNATKDVATAREFGDISENMELVAAQERQRQLLGRKNELERIFENCILID